MLEKAIAARKALEKQYLSEGIRNVIECLDEYIKLLKKPKRKK